MAKIWSSLEQELNNTGCNELVKERAVLPPYFFMLHSLICSAEAHEKHKKQAESLRPIFLFIAFSLLLSLIYTSCIIILYRK